MAKIINLSYPDNIPSTRLDKYLTQELEESRSKIKGWIDNRCIKINDETVTKTGFKVKSNDQINIEVPDEVPLSAEPQKMDLDIIYEDDDVIVINKPQGMVVHPSAGHPDNTLVNGLMYHTTLAKEETTLRPGIVHRIDKDTSGLLMIAKTELARESLMKQLKEKSNIREYLAIVHGNFAEKGGRISAPIGRSKKDRKKQAVIEDGKNAVTNFEVLEQFDDYSYLSLRLETGRTHQIRVHLKYIEHPVAGDPLYGPKKTLQGNGQFLHAYRLGFKHPRTGKQLEFTVKPPIIFEKTLEKLRNKL